MNVGLNNEGDLKHYLKVTHHLSDDCSTTIKVIFCGEMGDRHNNPSLDHRLHHMYEELHRNWPFLARHSMRGVCVYICRTVLAKDLITSDMFFPSWRNDIRTHAYDAWAFSSRHGNPPGRKSIFRRIALACRLVWRIITNLIDPLFTL